MSYYITAYKTTPKIRWFYLLL